MTTENKKKLDKLNYKKAGVDVEAGYELVEQINYSLSNELVSTDIVGNNAPAVYDSPATISSKDGKSIILYVWYDNEYGYSRQVMRLAKYISNVRRPMNY